MVNYWIKNVLTAHSRFINIDELLFDFAIFVIFSIIYFFGSENRFFIDNFDPFVFVFILIPTVLFSPRYLSSLYSRFKSRKNINIAYRILTYTSLILLWATSLFIVYVMPYFITRHFSNINPVFEFYFFHAAFGTLALALGWDQDKDGSARRFLYFLSLMMFSAFIFIGYIKSVTAHYLIIILSILFVIIAARVLIEKFHLDLDDLFQSNAVQKFISPFAISFLLAFANVIIYDVFIIKYNESTYSMFLALTISGILPTRIMLLLCPPFKIINFAIGLTAFVLFFVNILRI